MRLPIVAFLLAGTLLAQPGTFSIPKIDLIEFYGLRRVSPNLARQALGLKEGDPLPPSKADAEDRLLDLDRVVAAELEAVCCDENKTVLYVGIEEIGGPHYPVRQAPGGGAMLSEQVFAIGQRVVPYILTGPTAPSQLFPFVDANLAMIREVLRESGDEFHRAAAAYLLPYATRKTEIVDDLQAALTDNDATVRVRAMQALLALAQLGRTNPASGIRVPAEWFVPALTSVTWTDRKEAIAALTALTQDRDRAVLKELRGETLAALIEMSRWQTRTHAYPAFLLVGRVAGLRDVDTRDAWLRAGRETVIGQALVKAQ
ncbi:MAG: hypothetical protein WDO18_08475 [Acidobacteriota bacterium]